ncbi:MAG: hypothetical protein IAI48_12425 [Candidatus Eremiobacteraeota bacterium]|nr:hypothetical protein [Candidatus Eremiobacteraeota bacterium]
MNDPSPDRPLGMLPEVDARTLLSGPLTLRVLRPPYPAIGLGTLRTLRVLERDGATEIVAGYDGYERLGPVPRANANGRR